MPTNLVRLMFSVMKAPLRRDLPRGGNCYEGRFPEPAELRKIPRRVRPWARSWRHHDSHLAPIATEKIAAGSVITADPGLSKNQTTYRSAVIMGRDMIPSHLRPSLERFHM